jgi:ribosomal-protein-alanine N-acetyltransferase
MPQENQEHRTETVESFAGIFKDFGQAIGDIFNDPKLKEKAKEFAESASVSANSLADRLKEEDVREKFRDVGKAAEEFGKNIAGYFSKDKQ